MRKVLFVLLFAVALCLFTGCLSLANVPGTEKNVWVEDGFKLAENDELFIVTTENRMLETYQSVMIAFKKAGLIKSLKDPHIVGSIEEIKPSGVGRVFFVEYIANLALVEKIKTGYSAVIYNNYYDFFDIKVYDYQTKNLVASNYYEKKILGKPAVETISIFSTTNNLIKAIMYEK